jgi:hypothetical protein
VETFDTPRMGTPTIEAGGSHGKIEARLSENYPGIFMTILSLIVALVYENLIGAMKEQKNLWTWTAETAFLWSQCAFLVMAPLTFWFAHSLQSCSVRRVFARADAIVPILAAIMFNVLASNLGTHLATSWLLIAGLLAAAAWVAFGQFGRHYVEDGTLSSGPDPHRWSRRLMVAIGSNFIALAISLHFGVIGFGTAATVLLLLTPLAATTIFSVWYQEWRRAVRLGAEKAERSPQQS